MPQMILPKHIPEPQGLRRGVIHSAVQQAIYLSPQGLKQLGEDATELPGATAEGLATGSSPKTRVCLDTSSWPGSSPRHGQAWTVVGHGEDVTPDCF